MMSPADFKAFMARYFAIFMATVFVGCFSLAAMLVLVNTTYLKGASGELKGDFAALVLGTGTLLLVTGNVLIVRGVGKSVWVIACLFAACVLVTLPAIQFVVHTALYLIALLLPLVGLLLINSARHREMRARLRGLRAGRRR